MSVFWPPESNYAKELAKWEALPSASVPVPGRPYVFHEYPKMLFKAGRHDGGPRIIESRVAESDTQEAALLSRGYAVTQEQAIDAIHRQDQALAQAAAERAFRDQRMSAKAQAEAAATDQATAAHVGEIPERPIRRRRAYVRKKETS